MNDNPIAGDEPAGAPVPANKTGRLSELECIAKKDAEAVEAFLKRAVAGIEAWYARHHHNAAVNGTQPISASDKASLIQHVKDAATNPVKE